MNVITWTPRAAKQLRKLDAHIRTPIYSAIQELVEMPGCHNVKRLMNHEYGYRLRVGQYRVLFDWTVEIRIVEIQEVRKRDERTY
ncbi:MULTISPECIES: type II toxin-antitoxin system RelE family toxin [Herbaspirillum]|uniref:Type II toxin-antitoxin system RelE/ParE family toxin n=1 Tax=Herbaspirillum huttiense subsp. lycopersici TaxID=3074428 RepID=A0ABU2EHS6_9BURK|nr:MULTISPECIES: type II toxin-antitoxin system RelE/ParE family toxin [Herbaspirillum]MBP1313566.1 mRNA-degrading endonuclease RelE of RelBE toxin-antitoxin system [Herbaspirillum sp. 1130]MDR6738781.1 mRNA-degrading endonuclease RelE of RelBE toxin-antitoxin system [Herbaspirillum sp. 1173]MDR9847689.1 type II toxin-antitoxin system RelE/ParE family toxin [Herbaspirillum huttiense SE1]